MDKFLPGAVVDNRYCSLINLFSFLNIIFSSSWSVFGFWVSESKPFLVWSMLTPALFLTFFRMLTYLALNEYEWLQDVYFLNKFITKHNAKVDDSFKKKEEMQ